MAGCLRSRAGTDAFSGQASKARHQKSECGAGTVFEETSAELRSAGQTGRLSLRDLSLREAWLRQNACNAAFGGLHALGQGGEEHSCVRRDDKQDE
jgi:hypothetical protein